MQAETKKWLFRSACVLGSITLALALIVVPNLVTPTHEPLDDLTYFIDSQLTIEDSAEAAESPQPPVDNTIDTPEDSTAPQPIEEQPIELPPRVQTTRQQAQSLSRSRHLAPKVSRASRPIEPGNRRSGR